MGIIEHTDAFVKGQAAESNADEFSKKRKRGEGGVPLNGRRSILPYFALCDGCDIHQCPVN